MTKFLTRVLSIAMLLGVTAGAAHATQWPNATYPDTLNLFKVQFGMANPGAGNPALLDTVNGVGGIISGADAATKIAAGARLVQLYTGFIYRGPELVAEAAAAIARQRRV